jgi:hypothetical protein
MHVCDADLDVRVCTAVWSDRSKNEFSLYTNAYDDQRCSDIDVQLETLLFEERQQIDDFNGTYRFARATPIFSKA